MENIGQVAFKTIYFCIFLTNVGKVPLNLVMGSFLLSQGWSDAGRQTAKESRKWILKGLRNIEIRSIFDSMLTA